MKDVLVLYAPSIAFSDDPFNASLSKPKASHLPHSILDRLLWCDSVCRSHESVSMVDPHAWLESLVTTGEFLFSLRRGEMSPHQIPICLCLHDWRKVDSSPHLLAAELAMVGLDGQ